MNSLLRGQRRKSLNVKRSVLVAGRKTSVGLEEAFWNALKEIAAIQGLARWELISKIDRERQHDNLSSAIRLFVLDYYRQMVDSPHHSDANGGKPT